jgi:hypothetical protein
MAVTVPATSRETRSKTGSSKPRIIEPIAAPAPAVKKSAPKKKPAASTTTKKPAAKANTSKPLTKKTTSGKVTKKPAPAKKAKAAVNGAVKKVEKAGEKVKAKTEKKA